jgi:hypothetical protein
LPESLDDYVTEDNLIDELDLGAIGFGRVQPVSTGRPAYQPSALLKIYLYGYLNRDARNSAVDHPAKPAGQSHNRDLAPTQRLVAASCLPVWPRLGLSFAPLGFAATGRDDPWRGARPLPSAKDAAGGVAGATARVHALP